MISQAEQLRAVADHLDQGRVWPGEADVVRSAADALEKAGPAKEAAQRAQIEAEEELAWKEREEAGWRDMVAQAREARDAADAELERLRVALKKIAAEEPGWNGHGQWCRGIAREALNGKDAK